GAAALDGGGYAVSLLNEEHHQHDLEVLATCLSTTATTDNVLALVKSTAMVAKQTTAVMTSFCPADFPVALGGFSNAAGRALLKDVSSAPVWGTSANPLILSQVDDGELGPPVGWQTKVFNGNFAATKEVIAFAVCGNAPSLRTYVYSIRVPE